MYSLTVKIFCSLAYRIFFEIRQFARNIIYVYIPRILFKLSINSKSDVCSGTQNIFQNMSICYKYYLLTARSGFPRVVYPMKKRDNLSLEIKLQLK